MTRFGHRQQLLLLAAAASVPISLGVTAWPPAVPTHEVIVVQVTAAATEPCACESEPVVEVEPVVEAAAEPEPEPAPAWVPELPGFAWVVGGEIVLSTQPDDAWASGPVEALELDGVVTRTVAEAALPEGIRAAQGTRVEAYTVDGERCTGVIGAPRLEAEVEGDLEVLSWDDDETEDEEDYYGRDEAERRTELAPKVWEHGRRLLVAPVALDAGCDEPGLLRWARPQAERELAVYHAGREGRPRASLARSFLALPELVELSGELGLYAEEHQRMLAEEAARDDEGSVEPAPAPAGPSAELRSYLRAWRWRAGEGEAAAVTVATVGDPFEVEACGDFLTPTWGIATIGAEGELGPVRLGPDGDPIAIFDLEGDGQLEVMVSMAWGDGVRLMTITPTGLQERSALESLPSFGCPC